jgi:tetratricopeptide (TPR) repeat protein
VIIRPSDLPDFEQLRIKSRNQLDSLLTAPADDFEVAVELEQFMDRALQSRRIGDIARTVPNELAGEAAHAIDERCGPFMADEGWAALRVRALVFRNRGVKGGSRQRLQDRLEAESIARSLGNRYLTGYAIKWQGEAFTDLGKPKDSIREYRRALDVFAEEFNSRGHVESLVAGMACAISLIVKYRSNGRFDDAMDLLAEMRALEAGTGLDRDGLANLIRADFWPDGSMAGTGSRDRSDRESGQCCWGHPYRDDVSTNLCADDCERRTVVFR